MYTMFCECVGNVVGEYEYVFLIIVFFLPIFVIFKILFLMIERHVKFSFRMNKALILFNLIF